jgi:predicted lipoprotein with Yx(FWY)xxD motif
MLAAACGSSASAAVGPVYEIHAVKNSSLGTILADGKGYTVYLFEPDKQGTPTCLAGCASEWPPLMLPKGVTKPIAGPGINASLLGTVKRPGGGLQVTYNRWPLYRWIGDTSPGMTTGEGLDNLGGYWYVLNPAGDAVLGLGPRAGETSSY